MNKIIYSNFRIFLIVKQLKTSAFHYGFKSYENICVLHFMDNEIANEFAKLDKKRLFIELIKHENYLIVILIRIFSKDVINNDLCLLKDDNISYQRRSQHYGGN